MQPIILFKPFTIAIVCSFVFAIGAIQAQSLSDTTKSSGKKSTQGKRIFYGKASFYSNSFHGKRTANGEIFNQDNFTAACNVLPLGTWIRVTNLRNGKSVVVKTTDRLHKRMRRLVDLSRSAAKKLDYISSGLTRVKVEVLDGKPVEKKSVKKQINHSKQKKKKG